MVGSWKREVPVVVEVMEDEEVEVQVVGWYSFVIGSMGMSTSWKSIRRTRGESNSAT